MTSKHIMRWGSVLLVAICVQAGSAHAQGAASVDRLHRAIASNGIDDPQMKSWHLKLSFQLLDIKGSPTEKGTIEEWWAGPSMRKTVYTSPSYTSTQIQTKDGLYRTKGASSVPYLLELILQQVVHPMPSEEDIAASKPDLRKETFGKAQMDCIMLDQEIKNVVYPPIGFFPMYCLDRDLDSLRATYDSGSQLTVRNNIGTFLGRKVPMDQTTSFASVNAISAHIEALQTMPLTEADFVPAVELEEVDSHTHTVSAGVLRGQVLSTPSPIYPERAKHNHVAGTVIISVRIGHDGRIHSMKLISTPDSDLAIAALAAVRLWTYKPYLLNGKPTEVQTTVTVNFNFGPLR
jgi:TonB family protein